MQNELFSKVYEACLLVRVLVNLFLLFVVILVKLYARLSLIKVKLVLDVIEMRS